MSLNEVRMLSDMRSLCDMALWKTFRNLRLRRKLGTVSSVGIDIGTSTIKVLQLNATAEGENIRLQTYGQLASYGYIRRFNDVIQTEGFRFFEKHVVRLLDAVLERSGVTTRDVVFSVPIFSTFTTTIRLPYMEPEEMETAIPLQARQYVPSPLEEVQLSWLVVGYEKGDEANKYDLKKKEKSEDDLTLLGEGSQSETDDEDETPRYIRVLLIAAPKDVIQQYVDVVDRLDLNLQAIELESIALARAVVPDSSAPTLLLDIGARSTDVTMVDHGLVQLSHNVDIAGEALTKALVRTGERTFLEAERAKRDQGFANEEGGVREEFTSVIDQIVREIKRAVGEYEETSSRSIQNIILAGGTSMLKGVDRFFEAAFPGMRVAVGNPWKGIGAPDVLRPVLDDMGPAYGVAVGLALRQLKSLKVVNMKDGIRLEAAPMSFSKREKDASVSSKETPVSLRTPAVSLS